MREQEQRSDNNTCQNSESETVIKKVNKKSEVSLGVELVDLLGVRERDLASLELQGVGEHVAWGPELVHQMHATRHLELRETARSAHLLHEALDALNDRRVREEAAVLRL